MKYNLNNFDFILLVAAFMVIWGHAYTLLSQPGVPIVMGSTIHTFAVKVFFAVSGYLVMSSWIQDPNPIRFIFKRLLRIIPAFVVVVAFSALILGPAVTDLTIAEYFSSDILFQYFSNLIFYIHYALPGVYYNNIYPVAVNGSIWTLPVELFMYLLLLAVGCSSFLMGRETTRIFWCLLTLIVIAITVVKAAIIPKLFDGVVIYGTLVSASLELAPYFLVGGMLALFSQLIRYSVTVAIMLFFIGVFFTGTGTLIHVLNILFVCYTVVVFGSLSTPYIRQTGRFGDISYGVYLYGFPVAQTLSWAFGHDIPFLAHIFLALAFTIILAFFSWHLVEKPALSLKPKRKGHSGQLDT